MYTLFSCPITTNTIVPLFRSHLGRSTTKKRRQHTWSSFQSLVEPTGGWADSVSFSWPVSSWSSSSCGQAVDVCYQDEILSLQCHRGWIAQQSQSTLLEHQTETHYQVPHEISTRKLIEILPCLHRHSFQYGGQWRRKDEQWTGTNEHCARGMMGCQNCFSKQNLCQCLQKIA